MEAESNKMRSARAFRPHKKRKSEVNEDESPKQLEVKKPQRKSGKLAGLISLPFDLLFEIFGTLRPFDLLRVARTTKEFRRLLMHKSATSVWKSVLAEVPGLPDCPPGMNEPQWVNLVFDPYCHFCFTPGIRNVEWRFRMRICAKCAKDHLSERMFLGGLSYSHDYNNHLVPVFSTLVPSRPSKRGRPVYMIRDYYAVEQEYKAIEGKEAREAYIKEREKIVQEIENHAVLCEEWANGQTRGRSSELHQIRSERRLAIIKKLEDMGYGRDIESIQYPDSLEDHKLVKRPQRLTQRIWMNIRGPLIEFMQDMRKKRLVREHKELVLERKQSAVRVLRSFKNAKLPYAEIMPEGPDFCEFEPIKAILEQPADVTVDESSFTEILPSLPDLIATWRKGINLQLIRAMKNTNNMRRPDLSVIHTMLFYMGYGDGERMNLDDDDSENEGPSLTDDELDSKVKLATTVFRCNTCTSNNPFFYDDDLYSSMSSDDSSVLSAQPNPLYYPEVLGHRCLTQSSDPLWSWELYVEPIKRLDHYPGTRKTWTARSLRLDHRLGKMVEAVLTVAGMDPETTTPREMDDLGAWFACIRCAVPRDAHTGQTKAYGWRDAVVHQANYHGRPMEELRLLSAKEVNEARVVAIDENADALSKDRSEAHWLCTHCRDLPAELEPEELDNIKTHLRNRHEVIAPEVNKDYYRKFDAGPAFPAPCIVVLDVDIDDGPSIDDNLNTDYDLDMDDYF